MVLWNINALVEDTVKSFRVTGEAVRAVSQRVAGLGWRGGRVRGGGAHSSARSNEQELISGDMSVAVPLASPLSLAAYHAR